jgi:hypothetical protein
VRRKQLPENRHTRGGVAGVSAIPGGKVEPRAKTGLKTRGTVVALL